MDTVKIVSYGVGAIGSQIAKLLLSKSGVEIVGAIDIAADKVGKDLGEVVGAKKRLGVRITDDVESLLRQVRADVVVHSTTSLLKDCFSQLVKIVENGINVVSTCEELSFPYITAPKLTEQLNLLAHKHNVTVLGSGINPGFLMDNLVIALTGLCQEVRSIHVERVIDSNKRRTSFQKKIGQGLTEEEFTQKIREKTITGHVGLEQSIAMIAGALKWKLDRIEAEPVKPILVSQNSGDNDLNIGDVAGLQQRGVGLKNGLKAITLEFKAYAGAEDEYDSINIDGIPPINQEISPCVHGDLGTSAVIANVIPRVINAPSGLLTMKDLPVISATVEDMRSYLVEK